MRPDREGAADPILTWLSEVGYPARRLEPLSGDVSARHYSRVRLETGGSLILARYPETSGSACVRFLAASVLLLEAGVPVPAILAADCAANRMLLEDAGDRTLYEHRAEGWRWLEPYYREALELGRRIAEIDPARVGELNPPLDAGLLRRELDRTSRVLLRPRGLTGGGHLGERLEDALDELCRLLGDSAMAVCHRDFMVRNLIPSGPSPELRVIDHQDLRLGPRFYDLASLLNDSLFPPPELEERLLAGRVEDEDDRLDYARAVVQRSLKAAGTYEAFAAKGNPRHRHLIRPTLGRAAKHLPDLPETAPLAKELARRWRNIDLLD